MNNINVLGMIGQDILCLYEILTCFLKNLESYRSIEPMYGINGYDTYLVTNLNQEISVFVYEIIKKLNMKEELEPYIEDESFFTNLKTVRNSIHIRKPHGSFEKRAMSIIETIKNDKLAHFNISLLYNIIEPNAILLGSNIYLHHMHNDISDKQLFYGERVREYSENLGTILSGLKDANLEENNYFRLSRNCNEFSVTQSKIELFDFTFEALQRKVGLSESALVRVLLMHSYVSFINILFDELICADKLVETDTCWLFFLAKLYSIRYDEVMDSFDNLIQHAKNSDMEIINDLLKFKGFDRNEVLREFAQKLRNLIHYGLKNYPPISIKNDYFCDIETVYLKSTGTNSIYDFKELFYAMRFDMKMMELRFQRLFNINYPLDSISLELARGGRILE